MTNSKALSPDETEALILALHQRHPGRSYATSLVEGRVCLIIRPVNGDRFILPLPAPYRGSYCTAVEDLLKLDLEGDPLTPDDLPGSVCAFDPHLGQLSSLCDSVNAARRFLTSLGALGFEAPHLVQSTIHGVTLYWPRLDGGRIELMFSTRGMRLYPGPATGNQEHLDAVVASSCVVLRGGPPKLKTWPGVALDTREIAEALGVPHEPKLPSRAEPKRAEADA